MITWAPIRHLHFNPPDLHHSEAMGFDFDVGWSTHRANIDESLDRMWTA